MALHAGAAAALLIGQRRMIAEELREFDLRRAVVLGLSFLPAAVVGYGFERQIERAARRPAGDRRSGCSPARRRCCSPTPGRSSAGAARPTPADGLALGVAQAAALAPGVSRNGVTLAAARWRRFSRDQANLLSRTIALPIIVGATGAQGRPPGPPRHLAGAAPLAGDRHRRLLRLDPRLAAADRPGRARPRPLALRRLPSRAWPPPFLQAAKDDVSDDAYAKAGVDQGAADSAVAGLVRALGAIQLGRPSRQVPLPGHYASVIALDDRTRDRALDRRGRHQAAGRRGAGALRHGRDRLRGDERQRRDLRRRRAAGDARLHRRRPGRPGGLRGRSGSASPAAPSWPGSRSPAASWPSSASWSAASTSPAPASAPSPSTRSSTAPRSHPATSSSASPPAASTPTATRLPARPSPGIPLR